VDQQAQAAERGLALQSGHEVLGQPDPLQGRAQDELPRVQDERLALSHVDQVGEAGHLALHVDQRIPVVVEDPEAPIDVEIDRRGLDAVRVERLDPDPPGVDLLADRAVRQDHRGGV
jgi:hypothetical protein